MSSFPFQNMAKQNPGSPNNSNSSLSEKRENFEQTWLTDLPHSAERINKSRPQARSSLPSLKDVNILDRYEAQRTFHKQTNKNLSMKNNCKQDEDILLLMTKRLQEVESQNRMSKLKLQDALLQIEQKDKTIKELQNKMSKREITQSTENVKRRPSLLMPPASKCWVERAERDALLHRCAILEKQLDEMNDFFADYGLTFIGDNSTRPKNVQQAKDAHATFDFSKLVHCIEDLNLCAREGESRIVATNQGATFRTPDSVPLILYANGLILFSGPFRDYEDPSTRAFVQDILDGFFPTELQRAYPDGVPFKVVDKREKVFHNQRLRCKVFGGTGQRLGHKITPQCLNADQIESQSVFSHHAEKKSEKLAEGDDSINFKSKENVIKTRRKLTESEDYFVNRGNPDSQHVHKKRISSDEFLSKLPSVVIRNGNLVSIRDNLSEIFKIPGMKATNIVHIKSGDEKAENQIILKIRSHDGNTIYNISVSPLRSIKEVRALLEDAITDGSSYEIFYRQPSRFISLRHSNHSLLDYDITNNSVLIMLSKLPA